LHRSRKTSTGGGIFVFQAPERSINKKQMEKTLVCKSCGYLGKAKTVTKGSLGMEIVLWLFFIFPGVIYSIWRLSSKHKACPKCGNTTLIPYDSPMAQKTIAEAGITEETLNEAKEADKKSSNDKRQLIKFILIGVGVVYGISLISSIISDITASKTDIQSQAENQEEAQSDFELGTYKVESEELAYIDPKEVRIWKSFSERKLVGKLYEGDIVEVTSHDPENDYCQVKTKDITGWVACGWLKKVTK
jgi:Ca2+/Na+ antiporter